jgi:ADP-heptose:LPS heptosyltransferase/GT2 family glycosyltransferase
LISVVITSYNGYELLKKYLPDNYTIFKESGINDVIVIDDASTDKSTEYIKNNFPEINLITNKKNLGFSKTSNKAAKEAKNPIILFLNNDIKVNKIDTNVILKYFENTNLFSLTPAIYRSQNEDVLKESTNESITTGYFKGGWFSSENISVNNDNETYEGQPLLWACGGGSFINKKKFEALGGFDSLYHPFYVEDLDLSYRAWKTGWECLYTKQIKFQHQHQSTIAKITTKKKIEAIHLRNKYLFTWKNIKSFKLFSSHFLTVLIKLMTIQVKDISAISRALLRVNKILSYRIKASDKISDKEILNIFKEKQVINKPKKILIARSDMLGDTILATSVIKPLKSRFPKSKIYFLLRKEYFPLFKDMPEIDGLIEDPLPYSFSITNLSNLYDLSLKLKKYDFDIFIGLWEKRRYALLAKISSISTRVGHNTNFINKLLYTKTVNSDFRNFKTHQVEWNLKVLRTLQIISSNKSLYLVSQKKEELTLKQKYSILINRYVCISIDAKLIQKRLLEKDYTTIIDMLLETNIPIVLVGKEGHLADINKLKNIESPLLLDLSNKLNLKETMAIINSAEVFLGSDSGLIHMAAAYKTKTVVYFINRAQHILRWAPWKTTNIVIRAKHKCSETCDSLRCRKTDCRAAISAEEIISSVKKLYSQKTVTNKYEDPKIGYNILYVGKFDKEYESLTKNGGNCFITTHKTKIKELIKLIRNNNINQIITNKRSLKLKVARIVASNYIHYYPEIKII